MHTHTNTLHTVITKYIHWCKVKHTSVHEEVVCHSERAVEEVSEGGPVESFAGHSSILVQQLLGLLSVDCNMECVASSKNEEILTKQTLDADFSRKRTVS